jgi:hypothetical protein
MKKHNLNSIASIHIMKSSSTQNTGNINFANKRICFVIPDFSYIKKWIYFRPDNICRDPETLAAKMEPKGTLH